MSARRSRATCAALFVLGLTGGCHDLEPTRPMTPVLDPASSRAPEPRYREPDNPLSHELDAGGGAGGSGGGDAGHEHHHHPTP